MEYVDHLQNKFNSAFELARQYSKTQQHRQKVNYDRKLSGKGFEPQDKVWLFVPQRKRGLSPKLHTFWRGPYVIVKKLSDANYVISKLNSNFRQVVHFNRLKPYFERESEDDSQSSNDLGNMPEADAGQVSEDGAGEPESDSIDYNLDTGEVFIHGTDVNPSSPRGATGRVRKPPEWMRSGLYDLS